MKEKKFKQVCECINCGNEAEMMITCSLKPEEEDKPLKVVETKSEAVDKQEKIKGHSVCSHCGSEADIWLEG
ncbi:MAG: hypothetical protein JSV38_11850 [Desulfobacterales bacterium]|nr:MAG: hypothetical protein JSV38_11850 [Desulfobacterales bacterium]